ncbi:MAG: CSLREA domain-containing protein [Chloroflexi bacterium]|nr:CSLREA domain-containing protein [Chloroflexota bacterium]
MPNLITSRARFWSLFTSSLRFSAVASFVTMLILLAGILAPRNLAQAATFDIGCSGGVGDVAGLIAAITTANANGEADTINLAADCAYTLTAVDNTADGLPTGLPAITTDIIISGPNATITRGAEVPDFRFFYVDPDGHLTLNDVTVSNGNLPSTLTTTFGGALSNAGTTIINGSHFTSNLAGIGGAISNSGILTINTSTFTGNTAAVNQGGAIANFATVTISQSSFDGNSAANNGGALDNAAFGGGTATATIIDSTLSGNTAGGAGGALLNFADNIDLASTALLTVRNSALVGNMATGSGGGIFNFGGGGVENVVIEDSAITGNSGSSGGGVRNNNGVTTVTRSLINNNTSTSDGGGFYNDAGTLTIVNSTVSGNTASVNGGGIYEFAFVGGFTTHLNNVTITGNTADSDADDNGGGGGVFNDGGTINANNTIIAANLDLSAGIEPSITPDCSGILTSQGYNLIANTAGCVIFGDTTGNITDLSANLGPLADNGGPTFTHALLTGSPAIDAGDPAGCKDRFGATLETDQRGVSRPQDGDNDPPANCDIGAFELESSVQTGPVFTVNTSDDHDGLCSVDDCTLREAINAANAHANGATPDEIRFNIISEGSVQTIAPSSALPSIFDPVIIDGYTQPGASPNTNIEGFASNAVLHIELSGSLLEGDEVGLDLQTSSSVVRGLVINRFPREGIAIQGEGGGGNTIEGNFIGTDVTGLLPASNGFVGVNVFTNDNLIGGPTSAARNVISSNGSTGIAFQFSSGNSAQGNLIGVGADAVTFLPNFVASVPGGAGEGWGIFIGNFSTGHTIGGSIAGAGNLIAGNVSDGIEILDGASTIEGNTIIQNAGSGVEISGASTTGNVVRANSIFDNDGLGIDLLGDGVTANDEFDDDTGPNNLQNFPVLGLAIPTSGGITISGELSSSGGSFTLDFYASASCDLSNFGEGQRHLGATSVGTDEGGFASFTADLITAQPVTSSDFITATATDSSGNTSEFSPCAPADPNNVSWPQALQTPLVSGGDPSILEGSSDQFLTEAGQSRWYKFTVQPGSKLIVTLTNLPANYDLTVYKDIAQAFNDLTSPQDLVKLSAEFAPDSFSPDSFSPDSFSPDSFSPDSFSPDSFSPDSFSPDSFSPDSFSPDSFSPDSFSPDSFSPDSFSPDSFSPDSFSPDSFSPDSFSEIPEAYASAQTRSLIGISAFDGTASEGILLNTWDNAGDFYIRVRGRNGAFSLAGAFHLEITMLTGTCGDVSLALPASNTTATAGGFNTVILADLARMEGTAGDKAALLAQLNTLATAVNGVVVNVGADARVAAANTQADTNFECPFAKNLVAASIKSIVDAYRDVNPIQYVVIVGNDNVIPFFRHPDNALLANEQNYVPPVRDNTASQASLKFGYVLGQDAYGSSISISYKVNVFPIPDLPVGRLVETPTEVIGMINAFLTTGDGVVDTPASSLVTGYDFLEDAANAVQTELVAGLGSTATATDTLIAPRDASPLDPQAWTADQLRAALLTNRHDLIYLAGHFSASSALAADYTTRMLANELTASSVNLVNSIVYSAGCHSGYNIVNDHGIANVTQEPDWARAFAQKQATLIAGTGYQYGDTDFIEYSESIYLEFTRQLRTGTGPVSVGNALVAAKLAYLADTPQLKGIHEKALLEATIYGLPMISVNMPGERLTPVSDSSIVGALNGYVADPGNTLGLQFTDITVTPTLTTHTVTLHNPTNFAQTFDATYLSGSDGQVTAPAEPVLPLEIENVTANGTVLRGVGFRGGGYTDTPGILPLTGAATTELRGVHPPFFSEVFYPIKPWHVNYFEALSRGNGVTRLAVMPAQYQSANGSSFTGTLRQFNDMDFRLFYSNNTQTYGGNTPALAAAPYIAKVLAASTATDINFEVTVVGDPSAGVQEVWVTYTALSGPYAGQWQSLDLAQDTNDSRLWKGSLPLNGTAPQDIRYLAQAVNGVGLVAASTNLGAYYQPDVDPGAPSPDLTPTVLDLQASSATGAYSTTAMFTATLTSGGSPLASETIVFALGGQTRRATTDANGRAALELLLLGLPGNYELRAAFRGSDVHAPSSDMVAFAVVKQNTAITLDPPSVTVVAGNNSGIVATLKDAAGLPLGQKTIFFVVTGLGGNYATSVITDFAGRAPLGSVPLPPGSYTVRAFFGGTIPVPGNPITLDDPRYNSSSATGALTHLSPFPANGVLDNFNRRNGRLRAPHKPWHGSEGLGGYQIINKQVDVVGGGPIYWRNNPKFGANQEAYITFKKVDGDGIEQDLLLKVQGNSPDWRKGAIEVLYDARHNAVRVETFRPGNKHWTIYANIPLTLNDGDQFGAQALSNGQVKIFKNGMLVGTVTLNTADQTFFNNKGGRTGLWFIKAGDAVFDDFGGGNIP